MTAAGVVEALLAGRAVALRGVGTIRFSKGRVEQRRAIGESAGFVVAKWLPAPRITLGDVLRALESRT